jgi:hypothetical protein
MIIMNIMFVKKNKLTKIVSLKHLLHITIIKLKIINLFMLKNKLINSNKSIYVITIKNF